MYLPPLTADARWSVCVRNVLNGAIVADVNAGQVLDVASVGKLLLLIEASQQFAKGTLDPATPLARMPRDAVRDSGVWRFMQTKELPAADLCALIGATSDNLATNVLLRKVGLKKVARTADVLGLKETQLLDRVRDHRKDADPPSFARGNAIELSDLIARLHRCEIGSTKVSDEVLGWLSLNTDLSMVASAFRLDPLAHTRVDRGVALVNKTGTDAGVRADVGLATGSRGTLAWAVVANWDPAGPDARDAVLSDMAVIGEILRVSIR